MGSLTNLVHNLANLHSAKQKLEEEDRVEITDRHHSIRKLAIEPILEIERRVNRQLIHALQSMPLNHKDTNLKILYQIELIVLK